MELQGLLGKVGRQCYAVFYLFVVLAAATVVAHYVCSEDELERPKGDHRERAKRRLRGLHGPPLRSTRQAE